MRHAHVVLLLAAAIVACQRTETRGAPDAGAEVTRTAMRTPRQESEEVMNALLGMVKSLLSKQGEFYPIGASMKPDGGVGFVAVEVGNDHPPSQKLIDGMIEMFRAQAKLNEVKVAGLAYDVRTIPPGGSTKVDAVAVRVDHLGGESLVVYFPYRILPSHEVEFSDSFATRGPGDIFR